MKAVKCVRQLYIIYKMLGRAWDPRTKGTWLNKLTE